MLERLVLALVVVLCGVVSIKAQTSSGLWLNTTVCEGVFDFQVNSTLLSQAEANVLSYDSSASLYLILAPTWVTEGCKRAVRKVQCMLSYESALGLLF